MAQLTLTLIGSDRPGLVDELSRRVADAGGNWLQSRMARLGGQFAGILLIEIPDEGASALARTLQEPGSTGLHVIVEKSVLTAAVPPSRSMSLELVGQDRPGIVREVAHALAERGVNIEELETAVETGSFSSERLFRAKARLSVPETLATATLRDGLEALANELMVDLDLEETADAAAPS
jgi:glycine cleavage system regulatory protein